MNVIEVIEILNMMCSVSTDKKEKDALKASVNILERYKMNMLSGYLSFLNCYAVVEFYKDAYGREGLLLHIPENVKITNWYQSVALKCDLPKCFRFVAPSIRKPVIDKSYACPLNEDAEDCLDCACFSAFAPGGCVLKVEKERK